MLKPRKKKLMIIVKTAKASDAPVPICMLDINWILTSFHISDAANYYYYYHYQYHTKLYNMAINRAERDHQLKVTYK